MQWSRSKSYCQYWDREMLFWPLMKAVCLLTLLRGGVIDIMFKSTGTHLYNLPSGAKTAFIAVEYIYICIKIYADT